jgi:hypothetical protein
LDPFRADRAGDVVPQVQFVDEPFRQGFRDSAEVEMDRVRGVLLGMVKQVAAEL